MISDYIKRLFPYNYVLVSTVNAVYEKKFSLNENYIGQKIIESYQVYNSTSEYEVIQFSISGVVSSNIKRSRNFNTLDFVTMNQYYEGSGKFSELQKNFVIGKCISLTSTEVGVKSIVGVGDVTYEKMTLTSDITSLQYLNDFALNLNIKGYIGSMTISYIM